MDPTGGKVPVVHELVVHGTAFLLQLLQFIDPQLPELLQPQQMLGR